MKRVKCKCGTAYNATRVCCPWCGEDRPVKRFFEVAVLEIDDLEQPAKAFAERKGWLYEKVVSQSRKGWPDRLLAKCGRVILLEWKKPGKEPTAQQSKRHRELRDDYGLDVRWYNDLAQFMRDCEAGFPVRNFH
jgi:hypothetical protein